MLPRISKVIRSQDCGLSGRGSGAAHFLCGSLSPRQTGLPTRSSFRPLRAVGIVGYSFYLWRGLPLLLLPKWNRSGDFRWRSLSRF